MKRLVIVLCLGFVCSQLISCDDEKKDAMVWGTMKTDLSSDAITLNGNTIGRENADYVGYCEYKDKKFGFAIGEEAPPQTDLYYAIEGVSGPPTEDPYTADGTLRTDDDKQFISGQIWTTDGKWTLTNDNIIDEKCKVVLFAEGGASDLTPKEFGKKTFDYVLKIDCRGGLDYIPNGYDSSGQPQLAGFRVELWFANCD